MANNPPPAITDYIFIALTGKSFDSIERALQEEIATHHYILLEQSKGYDMTPIGERIPRIMTLVQKTDSDHG